MNIGDKFGRLTVLSNPFRQKNRRLAVDVECDCGTIKSAEVYRLISSHTKSCGCLKIKHNATKTVEYGSWSQMKGRCFNKKNKDFKHYGGRGITVCDRWKDSFENFISDMGSKPSEKHSIDRIDVDGHYEPSNCKWSTHEEQCLNKRPTIGTSKYRGVSKSKKSKKWMSYITVKGVGRCIGYFEDEISAAIAYDKAAISSGRKSSLLNFPDSGS